MTNAPQLEAVIVGALAGDQAVTGLLGGPKIFGRETTHASFPYMTLGRTAVFDWSRGEVDGSEDVLTLHVWAQGGGKAATFEIMDKVCERLHDSSLPLDDRTVVHLRLRFAQARQEHETPIYHGILRFSAKREPLA